MTKASDSKRRLSTFDRHGMSLAIQKQIKKDIMAKKKSAEKPLKLNMPFKDALKKVVRHKTK
jgi:hypothetical protein